MQTIFTGSSQPSLIKVGTLADIQLNPNTAQGNIYLSLTVLIVIGAMILGDT